MKWTAWFTSADSMPTYTVDWTSHHVESWSKHLSHLKDKPCIGLEIGVFEGRSTDWFCKNILTHDHSRLICVDPFRNKEKYQIFLRNAIENDLLHKLDIRRQPSEQMVIPCNMLSMIYLDGWHSADAVMMDAMLCWRSLKSDGILIFDDYHWPGPNATVPYLPPKPAIDSFLHIFASKLELLERSNHVIVRKK